MLLTTHPELTLLLLFAVALFAGFIDTLAGGGGLITIPALMLAGIPLLSALATNKLQASMGSMTASLTMLKKKQVCWKVIRRLVFSSFIGAAVGTFTVQIISSKALSIIIPVILTIIAVYFLSPSKWTLLNRRARMSTHLYTLSVIPAIGFYDGFFGPGTGSFFCMAGSALKGLTLQNATAQAKVLNFASNIASLLLFILAGHILWLTGIVMMAGQVIGAFLASHLIVKGNIAFIRPLIVIMSLLMIIRYALQQG